MTEAITVRGCTLTHAIHHVQERRGEDERAGKGQESGVKNFKEEFIIKEYRRWDHNLRRDHKRTKGEMKEERASWIEQDRSEGETGRRQDARDKGEQRFKKTGEEGTREEGR